MPRKPTTTTVCCVWRETGPDWARLATGRCLGTGRALLAEPGWSPGADWDTETQSLSAGPAVQREHGVSRDTGGGIMSLHKSEM